MVVAAAAVGVTAAAVTAAAAVTRLWHCGGELVQQPGVRAAKEGLSLIHVHHLDHVPCPSRYSSSSLAWQLTRTMYFEPTVALTVPSTRAGCIVVIMCHVITCHGAHLVGTDFAPNQIR